MRCGLMHIAVGGCIALAATSFHAARAVENFGERAFVDFHARPGPDVVGHTYIVYGRLSAHGEIIEAHVAGLYTNDTNYWKGLFIPLRAKVGRAKDDLNQISEVVYQRQLTAEQFYRLKSGVEQFRANQHTWHLLFMNCNDFAGEMAELIGLRRPPSLMPPITYVALLSAMNGR
jgi:hypothetical protein